jgi:hypothetical protein
MGKDGSEDGYAAADAGNLVATEESADPCANVVCDAPTAAKCDLDGVTALTYALPATCQVVDNQAVCVYTETKTDCFADGKICRAGACVAACPDPDAALEAVPNDEYKTPYVAVIGGGNSGGICLENNANDFLVVTIPAHSKVRATLKLAAGVTDPISLWSYSTSDFDTANIVDGGYGVKVLALLNPTDNPITRYILVYSDLADDNLRTQDVSYQVLFELQEYPVIFFSQYMEGGGYYKAAEIYNHGEKAVDLAGCRLINWVNSIGDSKYSTVLETSVEPKDVWVVCSNQIIEPAKSEICDQLSGSVSWNGDDTVELVCGEYTMDVIGKIGVDPGTGWSKNGVQTWDQTLRRKCGVVQGDTNSADDFDPSLEWDNYPKDDYSGFGSHSTVCPVL